MAVIQVPLPLARVLRPYTRVLCFHLSIEKMHFPPREIFAIPVQKMDDFFLENQREFGTRPGAGERELIYLSPAPGLVQIFPLVLEKTIRSFSYVWSRRRGRPRARK